MGNGISLYRHREKQTNIYCPDYDKLYEIFYLSFESLIGEELDGQGLHRIHCLALEKHGRATILLLPPGAGKTTLALKFLGNDNIKVLTEDILLYKKNCLYGLHFRWGTNDESFMDSGRIMKREKYKSKILLDASRLSLSRTAKPKNIILGQRTTSEKSEIIRISKIKLFFALFKSMVLGLELQQSLAYFLLRNHRDAFLKSKIGFKRLCAMSRLLCKSKGYVFYMGFNIEKNYNTLSEFVKQTN